MRDRDPNPSIAVTAVRVGLYLAAALVVLVVLAAALVLWGFHRVSDDFDDRRIPSMPSSSAAGARFAPDALGQASRVTLTPTSMCVEGGPL